MATIDGRRVTSPARTICDLAPELPSRRLVHLVETQLSRRCPAPGELLACLDVCWRRGVAGTARLRQVVAELVDEEPFPESLLELAVFDGLQELGVTGLKRQFRPPWYDGIRGMDGRRFRQVTEAHDNDRRRDRAAVMHGWATIRVGWRELQRDRRATLSEMAEIILGRRQGARRPAA